MSERSQAASLHLVASSAEPEFTVATQALFNGPQETAVRVLKPINGSHGPPIAVRVGRILVMVGDREALASFAKAWQEAEGLAEKAFGGWRSSQDWRRQRVAITIR